MITDMFFVISELDFEEKERRCSLKAEEIVHAKV